MALRFTPSTCHINLGAIARNFQRISSAERQMPVIKADAYGHGIIQVAATLQKAGATRFAVGTVSEGAELRKQGFRQTILPLLGCLNMEERRQSLAEKLLVLIGTLDDLEAMRQISDGQACDIALKFDTGMGRLGFNQQHLPALLDNLARSPHLRPAMAISHLACADMPAEEEFTRGQRDLFNDIMRTLRQHFPHIDISFRNSAACATLPDQDDILRPGIALYGGNPLAGAANEAQFPQMEWAMSFSAPILQIREITTGDSVSYGRSFIAERPMRLAVIGAGYGVGVSRSLSNKMYVLIKGKRARQIGRICMGMLMADISAIPEARAGDDAWIMGGEALEPEIAITAQELAERLQTIPYEILCLLGSLNPRLYRE